MAGSLRPSERSQTVPNRRVYPRRRTTFPATYSVVQRTQQPAYGLDIGGGGIQILAREELAPDLLRSISVRAVVGERSVAFAFSAAWRAQVQVRGERHFRYGLKLKSIADSDWDFIMDHSLDGEGGPGLTLGEILSAPQRSKILPMEKQMRIAALLIERRRLVGLRDRLPLVEYSFDGYAMRSRVPYYKLVVRSRIATPAQTMEFKTNFLVAVEGDAVRLAD